MKNVKRFLALLLAVLMVSGNIISAVAAEMDGADVAEESVAVEAAAGTADTAEADDDTSDTLYNNAEESAEDEQAGEAADETVAADGAAEADMSAGGEEAADVVDSVAAALDSLEVIAVAASAAEAVETEGEDESTEPLVSMNDYTYGQEPSEVVCADGWTITDVKYAAVGDEETTSEDAPKQVGKYVAIVTVESESESKVKVESLTFNVLPAVITVTADDRMIVYGNEDPDLTDAVTVKGNEDKIDVPYTVYLEGYNQYDINGVLTAETRPAGEYTVYVTSGGKELSNPNYTVEYVNGTLTVNPKEIADLSFQTEYDYTLQEPLVSVDTLTNGVDYNYTFEVDENDASIITVTITGMGNYTGSRSLYCMVTMTSLADYTVTLTDIPEDGYVYDGGTHNPGVEVTDAAGNLLDESCYTVSYFATVSAGTGYVYVDGVEDLGYAGRTTASFTIAPRSITVVIDEKTVEYGKAAEDLTYTITKGGLADGDTLHCALTTGYKAGDPVGFYDITATLLADVLDEEGNVIDSYDPNFNYEIKVIPATLIVVPAGREGFSVENYNGVYDGTPHFVFFTGLEEGKDEIAYSVNGGDWTAEAPSITNVGVLNVQVRVKNGDYAEMTGEGALYDATLEVTPAEITVTTEGAEKIYNGEPLTPGTTTVVFGDTTVSFEGNSGTEIELIGDDIGIISVTGDQTEVGSTETRCSLDAVTNGSTDNYKINYTPGTLTVKDYPVVTVDNVDELETEIIYDGKEHKWVPELTADGETLPANAFWVRYSRLNWINAGEITAIITLKDGYTFKAGEKALTAEYTYTIQKQLLPFAPVLKDAAGYTLDKVAEGEYVVSREYDSEALSVEDYLDAEITGLAEGENAPYIVIFSEDEDGSIEYTVYGQTGYILGNYEIPAITISLESTPRDIGREDSGVTAALKEETAVYDGKAHEPEVIVTYGKTKLVEGTDYTVSYNDNVNAGTGKVVITGTGNFKGTLTATFEIAQAALAIRPDTAQFVYNGEVQVPGGKIIYDNRNIEFTYSNPISVELGNGDTVILTRPENFITPVGAGAIYSNCYNYAIIDKDDNDASGNYVIDNDINVKFSITRAELTGVTVEMKDTEYGTALAPSTVISDSTNVGLAATYNYETSDGEPITGAPRDVGTYKVYATWTKTANYEAGETEAVEFKITPKPVTVTANNATKTYGDADPDLTYTVDGLEPNDDASVISATAARAEGENVGTYAIAVSGEAEQGNYTVIYKNDNGAALTVEPRSITAKPETVKLSYGDAVPAEWNLKFEILNGALVGDDTLRYDSVSTNYTGESAPGTYTLTVGAAAERNPNYNVTWEAGTITVNDGRDIAISGQGTYTYDGQSHNFVVTGLMPGDTVTYKLQNQDTQTLTIGDETELTIAGTADAGSVTLEKIVISNPEYRDYGGDNLTVTVNPAALSVTRPANLVYNGTEQQPQAVTVTAANGLTPVEGTDYDVAYSGDMTNAGTVTVTVTGKGNYAGTHDASYQIIPKTLVVVVPNLTKDYDGEPLTATAYIEEGGLVGNDSATVSVVNGQTYASEITNAGTLTLDTYNILWEAGSNDSNYSVTLRPGTLTVNRRDVADVSVAGALTYTYDGTNHWCPALRIAGGMTLTAGTDYDVTYSTDDLRSAGRITATVYGAGNFNGFTTVTYTINPAPLTVTTASAAKTYDGTALTAGGSISGLLAGDTVTFSVTGRQTAVGSSRNTYGLLWNGTASAANYVITENLGTLTVNPAPVLTGEGNDPADGEEPADEENPTDDEGLTPIEADETPLSEAPAGDYRLTEDGTVTTLEEDETPLAGSPLEDADCIMHYLLLIATLAVAAYYGYTRKKHRELEKKLQDEITKV